MADAPARDAAAKIQADMASAEVAAALSKLGGLPGVASVNTKPQKPAKVANNFGVCFTLRLPGGVAKNKRSAVTGPEGARPTFLAAVQAAIESTTKELMEHGVQINTGEQDDWSRQSPARIFEPYARLSSFLLRLPRARAHAIEPHTKVQRDLRHVRPSTV